MFYTFMLNFQVAADGAHTSPDELLKLSLLQNESTGQGLFGFTMSGLLISLLFGIIGIFYFRYGKKNTDIPYILTGLVLMIFPYFVSDTLNMFLIGVGIMLALYFLKKFNIVD